MVNSKQLAGLIGPTLIVLSLSEAKNLHIWAHNNAPVTYLAGLLWFVAGLAVVRVHNHWRLGWALLITLSGWLALCIGLFRAFFPRRNAACRMSLLSRCMGSTAFFSRPVSV